MPPTEVSEARIQDAIVVEMNKIGVAGSWLMTSKPFVDAGLPADPVPDMKYQIYVQYSKTEMQAADAGTVTRRAHAMFEITCFARGADQTVALRMLLNLKADVLRAIYAAESTFYSAWGYGIWCQNFSYDAAMSTAGIAVGVQEVFVDFE